jgi:thioredoxin 1
MPVILSTDADFNTILQNNPKVVVKYFADWCGNCKLFAPKFRRMSESPDFEGVIFIDVNAETNPEARKLANVDNLPFFATFNNGVLESGTATSLEPVVTELINTLKSK